METSKFAVPVEKLRWRCDAGLFKFECTKDLPVLDEFVGQERAIRAIEFGLNMPATGYNIFIAGLTGTGKTTIVKEYIERLIRQRKAAQTAAALEDWCYLHNFKEPDRPQIVNLPRGAGQAARRRGHGPAGAAQGESRPRLFRGGVPGPEKKDLRGGPRRTAADLQADRRGGAPPGVHPPDDPRGPHDHRPGRRPPHGGKGVPGPRRGQAQGARWETDRPHEAGAGQLREGHRHPAPDRRTSPGARQEHRRVHRFFDLRPACGAVHRPGQADPVSGRPQGVHAGATWSCSRTPRSRSTRCSGFP